MKHKLQRIHAIMQMTFMDGLRKHALIGLIVLSLLLEFFGIFFMDFFGHDVGRASSDFLISIIWLAGMVFLYFHAVQSIAWSEEQKVIHIILSRPISRAEYVLGTFFGLSMLLLTLQLFLGVIAWGSLLWIKTQVDAQYFAVFNIVAFVLSVCGVMVMQLCVLAMILLFSGALRGAFLVLLMSIAYYGICSGLPVVLESVHQQMVSMGETGNAFYYLLKSAEFVFPDFSRLDFKDYVLQAELSWFNLDVLVQFVFSLSYIIIMLTLACRLYARRDL